MKTKEIESILLRFYENCSSGESFDAAKPIATEYRKAAASVVRSLADKIEGKDGTVDI